MPSNPETVSALWRTDVKGALIVSIFVSVCCGLLLAVMFVGQEQVSAPEFKAAIAKDEAAIRILAQAIYELQVAHQPTAEVSVKGDEKKK